MAEPIRRPLISVVIPLFNKASYIAEALASVKRQSFSDYEVIVVDDGSTDDGASIVAATTFARMRLIQQVNAGVSVARNSGVAHAFADFVAFLDADDVWRQDHLKHLWELHLSQPQARLLSSAFREVNTMHDRNLELDRVTYRNVNDFIHEAATGQSWIFTSAAMVHRESCLSAGGFEVGENRGEDLDMWIKMALKFPVAMSDYVGSFYRRVENSLTSNLIREPDVAMRRIAGVLTQDDDISAGRKRSLKELYNRIAVSHATDCLAKGYQEAALSFLTLASDTQILRRRWMQLRVLCFMPHSFVVVLRKIRGRSRAAMVS